MTDHSRKNKNNTYSEILNGKNRKADLRSLLALSDGAACRDKTSIPGIAVGWVPGRPLPSFRVTNKLPAKFSSETDSLETGVAAGNDARGGG